jgi:RNA polymerase sigma factor (sigma-70 family)
MQLSDTEKSNWNVLYRRFSSKIFAYLMQQVSNQQDVEELLLEVFLSVLKETALETWPEDRQLAWLRRVARNKVIDYYRHQKLINWLPLMQASKLADERMMPEERVEQKESYRQLFLALNRLSPDQQKLIRLRYGQELHLVEIARILERPEGVVRKMLTRTLRRLRTSYEQLERVNNNGTV